MSPETFWDDIIVVSDGPFPPQTLRVDNDTDDHYVARSIIYSWQESSDNIAGIKGYLFDLIIGGSLSVTELCHSLDDFDQGSLLAIEEAIAAEDPELMTRTSTALLPSDISVSIVDSKIRVSFTNASSTAAGHEIQFHNDAGNYDLDTENVHIRAKINPVYPSGSNGTFYLGWQNFPYNYENAKAGGVLGVTLSVSASKSVLSLPITLEVGETTTSSAQTLGISVEVVPSPKTTPLYVDFSDTVTDINAAEPNGFADFLLVEIDDTGEFHLARPVRNGSGIITSVDVEDFPDGPSLDVNDVDQILEVAYRENRMDLEEYTDDTFSWDAQLSIKSSAANWVTPPMNVLWQKIRTNSEYSSFNRIQIRVDNRLGRQAKYRFYAYLVPADSGGLPTIANASTYEPKTNPAGIEAAAIPLALSLVSGQWSDDSGAPIYDASLHRLWWETVELSEGVNDITLLQTGFTASVSDMSLSEGQDFFLGIVAMKVKDGLTPSSLESSWDYYKYARPSIAWQAINGPVSTFLPEKVASVRGVSDSDPKSYTIEYVASDTPTHPAMFRVLSSTDEVVDSTYPKDMASGAEIIATWEDVDGSVCTRIIAVTDRDLMIGKSKYAVFGFRAAETSTDFAQIDYDYLATSNGTVISGIDLADDAGFTRTAIDHTFEETYTIDSKTAWSDSDWGITWAKRYGFISGIDITVGAPTPIPNSYLYFDAPAGATDGIMRSAEAHMLQGTGASSFESEFNFALDSEFLESEFYFIILPERYEGNVSDITQTSAGTPSDFILFGFRYNGDIYLYRPNDSGIVEGSLVRTLGSLNAYSWASGSVRIRVDNSTPGISQLAIWHGGTLIYQDVAQEQLLPQSDLGFWIGLGYRNERNPSYTLRMEVGNFVVTSVQRNAPETEIEFIHAESFADLPASRWFTYQGIEQIRDIGGNGSWLEAGSSRTNTEMSYLMPHRLDCPYNVACRGLQATIPGYESLNHDGNTDLSRLQFNVNIDDTTTIPEFGSSERWVGPFLMLGKGISDQITTTESIKFDLNYESGYPDYVGESELLFGIANWVPEDAAGTAVDAYENYAAYSFIETDYKSNTRARVYALSGGNTVQVGMDTVQYGSVTPQFVMLSFASDGKAYVTKGSLNLSPTSDSSAPTISSLGSVSIPGRGKMSIIVEPTTGSTTVLTGTLAASPATITLGQSTVLSWTSIGATAISYSTGDFALGKNVAADSSTVTPSQTGAHTYDIVFQNSDGEVFQASAQLVVNPAGTQSPTINAFSCSPSSFTYDPATGLWSQQASLTWDVSGADRVYVYPDPLSGNSYMGPYSYPAVGSLTLQLLTYHGSTYNFKIKAENSSTMVSAERTISVNTSESGTLVSGTKQYIGSMLVTGEISENSETTQELSTSSCSYMNVYHSNENVGWDNPIYKDTTVFITLPPPDLLPPVTSTISSAKLVLTLAGQYGAGNVQCIRPSGSVSYANVSGKVTGDTVEVDVTLAVRDWVNNQNPDTSVFLKSPDNFASNASLADLICPSNTQQFYLLFASPTHPNANWRPYWQIDFTTTQSVASVPAGIQSFASENASIQSSPTHCNIKVLVDGTQYAYVTNVPFSFFTTQGLRFFTGVRRKTPSDRFDTSATLKSISLSYVNQRASIDDTTQLDLAIWEKTDGVIPSNTLFYGRNASSFQCEDAVSRLITGTTLFAQTFVANDTGMRAFSLRSNASSYGPVSAYLCECDTDGLPKLTPSSGVIDPTDANIVAESATLSYPGMEELFFIFSPRVTLVSGQQYAVVIEGSGSIYGTLTEAIYEPIPSYSWNTLTLAWTAIGGSAAFRVFGDIYINRANTVHGEVIGGRVAAISNASLESDYTAVVGVTADLLPPHDPDSTSSGPTLAVVGGETGVGTTINYGRDLTLRLGAEDRDVIGSGVWEYRVVYQDSFDQYVPTDYARWYVGDESNYLDINMIYPGQFLTTKRFYAEIRDAVGNVSRTNNLDIEFKNAYIEDTTPPSEVVIRIEGDADLDPDPDEATVVSTEKVDVTIKVVDDTSGCNDVRLNHNNEEDSSGNIKYDNWRPYQKEFEALLTGEDGLYSLSVQARDYGYNSTLEQTLQLKAVDYSLQTYVRELPTAVVTYRPSGFSQDRLYIGTTRRTSRVSVEGHAVESATRTPYTAYDLWISNVKQTFKSNETIVVRVNGTIVPESGYERDDVLDLIIFPDPLLETDTVTADITEEVAVLYRFDGQKKTLVKVFDAAGGVGTAERAISALCVYGDLLYIGTESGNIYTHNGVRTSLPIYRTLGSDGVTPVPVSCMKAIQLSVDSQEFLYAGSYSNALVFRYGGSAADSTRMWQKVTGINYFLTAETNIFDIEVYEDVIVLATGPYGKVFRITKEVSSEGVESYTAEITQLYAEEFAADPAFRMDVLCLEPFGGKIFAGVDYRSSVFVYEKKLEAQPKTNEWTAVFNLNKKFDISPSPWRFYNDGIAYSSLSSNAIFTEVADSNGKIVDWWVTIIGKKGSYCLWLDSTDLESAWGDVDNTTGWTLDFSFKFAEAPAKETAYQAVQILDGTHQLELRLYKNQMVLVSGENYIAVPATVEMPASPISGGTLSTLTYFQTSVWTTYRIASKGNLVSVYANGLNTPLIETEDLFDATLDGSKKSIMFGKTDDLSEESSGQWRDIKYYIEDALPPQSVIDRDFVRDQIIPFGNEIRYLVSSRDGLLAGVQPRDPSEFIPSDDPAMIYPQVYLRTTAAIPDWNYDSTYESIGSSLTGGAATLGSLVYSTCEVSSNPMTNNPVNMRDYYTADPHPAMIKNGIVYVRRHTQAYDEIYKDTKPPDGAIIINENTFEGGLRVHLFQVLNGPSLITDGTMARYSALNEEVEEANNVSDGDIDTYNTIGTNDIRYLKQDFGGDGSITKPISVFKWAASAPVDKTYRIEYQSPDTKEWIPVIEMIAIPGGQSEVYTYTMPISVAVPAVRVYYSGDWETVSKDVEVTISSKDEVIGTSGYRLGRKPDLSDSSGWVDMEDGTSIISWDLMPESENWADMTDTGETLTSSIVFDGKMLLGASSGIVISSENGTSYTSSSSVGEGILCFAEHEGFVYLGTDGGKIYVSEDGGTWTLAGDTGEDSVESLASFNGSLYAGTGELSKLFVYEGDGEFTLVRRFPSLRVKAMFSDGSHLYIGLEDSGQMFKYDGSNFIHIGDLDGNYIFGIAEFTKDNRIYAAGDKGRIYSHDKSKNDWSVLLDTSHLYITGVCQYVNSGAEITSIQEDGSGTLSAATYSYIVTWVDGVGNESGPGEAVQYVNLSPAGKARIDWRSVEGAEFYRVYRSTVTGTSVATQMLLETSSAITTNYFEDDGSYAASDKISVPTEYSVNELWFSGSSKFVYSYGGSSVKAIPVPTSSLSDIAGIIAFKSNIYIFGFDGGIRRFSGINVGSGKQPLYGQFRDLAGNTSDVVKDDIFYNALIENAVVEVDEDGDITDQYSSVADPPVPIFGAAKSPEEIAIYESEPYYSATLSKWDTIDAVVDLPPETEVRLYVRTAISRDALDEAEWQGPYSASNNEDPYYYAPYYGYYGYGGYEYEYETYQYYETPDIISTISHDISLLSGSWIQFKLVLISRLKDRTPAAYSVIISFTTAKSTEFFTTMFDLDAIANAEREQESGIQLRRGLLTWQGTVPSGGEVSFGICTKDTESREWSDYQMITPDQVFTVTPGGHFKIGIILTSTDAEEAVVDEFAVLLDTGERSVKINLHAYDSL